MEQTQVFSGSHVYEAYARARKAAIDAAAIGPIAVPFVQELGPFKGRVSGMRSVDGLRGWRLDYHPLRGLHLNWWVTVGGRRREGANLVTGGTQQHYWELMSHMPASSIRPEDVLKAPRGRR